MCKLKRSIYGLKQSSRQWYLKIHRAVLSNGFTMIEEDHCVYVKRSKGSFIVLSLYVDDILLAGNDMEMIITTEGWLYSNFEPVSIVTIMVWTLKYPIPINNM